VARLREGDEEAFLLLVARHSATMLRLAISLVDDRAVAEEVVQDAWLAVLRGIDRFEGRSSLRTWVLAILVNRARTAGASERRSLPIGDAGPAVDAACFDATGHWMSPPQEWVSDTDDRLTAAVLSPQIRNVVESLPARQRAVLMLRDVDGLTSAEVCAVLEIAEGHERVLLHRARSRLRDALRGELEKA
jgi:RNA polymerase sigma-70 factor (ECF subfamily)